MREQPILLTTTLVSEISVKTQRAVDFCAVTANVGASMMCNWIFLYPSSMSRQVSTGI